MPIKIDSIAITRLFDDWEANIVEIFCVLDNSIQVFKRPEIKFMFNYTNSPGYPFYSSRLTYEVETIPNPGTPTRTGYTFNGWYTASSGGTKLEFPYAVPYTSNSVDSVSYYAHWTFDNVKTATPEIVRVSCYNPDGALNNNQISVTIKNNDDTSGYAYINNQNKGTIGAGATRTWVIGSGEIPYDYSVLVYMIATGKTQSNKVTASGTLYLCTMGN